MRTITVILSQALFGRDRAEQLRLAVGLLLRGDKVQVIFRGEAAWAACPVRPEIAGNPSIQQYLDALADLEAALVVEQDSMPAWVPAAKGAPLARGFEIKPAQEVHRLIAQSDLVISY